MGSNQIQAVCNHTHVFYHFFCPTQSLTAKTTKVVFGCLLLIGGMFAIYSAIVKRFSTPSSPKTPEIDNRVITGSSSPTTLEVNKQVITGSSSSKTLEGSNQAIQSTSIQPGFHVWMEMDQSRKHDYNDAHHLDSSMVGKKISEIQDIETVLRLFPKPLSKYEGSKMWAQQDAFSHVSNEVLSTFLENQIDGKVYLVDYFSDKQIRAINIDKVPLSNLEKLFFPDVFPNHSGGYFNTNLFHRFNFEQRKIMEPKLKKNLKKFSGFEHLT